MINQNYNYHCQQYVHLWPYHQMSSLYQCKRSLDQDGANLDSPDLDTALLDTVMDNIRRWLSTEIIVILIDIISAYKSWFPVHNALLAKQVYL